MPASRDSKSEGARKPKSRRQVLTGRTAQLRFANEVGTRQSKKGQGNPQLDIYVNDKTPFQDRLVQWSLDMRGPDEIGQECGEVIEQVESYTQKYGEKDGQGGNPR